MACTLQQKLGENLFLIGTLIALVVSATSIASVNAATPAFSAHKNGTNQTVVNDTDTLLTWSTEGFDTNNNFATNRFTPTVAGKYLIVVSVHCQQAGYCMPAIRKNGATIVARAQIMERTVGQTPSVTAIVDMNGSTDYVEAMATSSGSVIAGTIERTYFSGSQIDGSGTASAAGSAGQIQFNEGGNLQSDAGLHWDNTNKRLGIGTATPSAWVHIDIGGTGVGRLQISDSSAPDGYMGFGEGGSAANSFFPLFIARPSGATAFTGYYSEVLTANDTGSVPVAVFVARQSPTAAVTTRPLFDWRNNATSMMTMLANGNVGIGIASPVANLHVHDSDNYSELKIQASAADGYAILSLKNDARDWRWQVQGTDADKLYLYDATALLTRMVVDSSGNVGIGTATPDTKLTVSGSVKAAGYVQTCPAGFTEIGNAARSLGCMQTAENTAATWPVANDACFDSYGGRLAFSSEWHIAAANYALTGETGNWEWLADAVGDSSPYDNHAVVGSTSITDLSWENDTTAYTYRCFLPK